MLLYFNIQSNDIMRVVKQSVSLPISNHDFDTSVQSKRHGPLLPSSIRSIIAGPSNCGKTNVIIGLIENTNGLRFENVYVFSKSLNQPKYLYLEHLLKPIKGMGYYPCQNYERIVSPNEAKPNSIFIFDDIACDKQAVIREYFSMGRHKSVDCFYLCQTYSHIPKHLIRDNANLIILFKQDELNLKHVYADHVNTDMSFDKFKDLCGQCWKEKYGFLVIDKDSDLNNGRYRKYFDHFIFL